jgi:excisionase family DNA binding protein
MGSMNNENLATPQEMAAILNVPVSWIYRRTRLGSVAIPHIKMGKYVRFKPAEVIDFFKAKENSGAS